MIEYPPKLERTELLKAIKNSNRKDILDFVNHANEQYLYWNDLKYKPYPKDMSPLDMWASVKLNRMMLKTFTWNKYGLCFSTTNNMLRLCHYFDMNFGGTWGTQSIIPQDTREQYLISSLMEEAISSSQMEGASTTRRIAKDMLRKQKSPRNRSEQMIYNNYMAIRFLVEHKKDDLSRELLLQIHSLMTYNTLDDDAYVGKFRDTNDVVVANMITNEVVHTPPDFGQIEDFVSELCTFANKESDNVFIHPILKAIIIHFLLSYVHPFVDGNGRTARALFYWYMLKNGYWLTEYLSISRIIYKSKTQYENMFLYTEADEGDMGYFITYHLRVLKLAFQELQNYIQRKLKKQRNIDFLRLGALNERQAEILSWFRSNPDLSITIKEIETRFGISHPTAVLDIKGLLDQDYLQKVALNKKQSIYIEGSKLKNVLNR